MKRIDQPHVFGTFPVQLRFHRRHQRTAWQPLYTIPLIKSLQFHERCLNSALK
jgi:hypothetical protein